MNHINYERTIKQLDKAIVMMQTIDPARFDLRFYQSESSVAGVGDLEVPKQSIQEIHSCGTSACFAGYAAIWPDFIEDGIKVTEYGIPEYDGFTGVDAIERLLNISYFEARQLVMDDMLDGMPYYSVQRSEVTPAMVVDKLRELRDMYRIADELKPIPSL